MNNKTLITAIVALVVAIGATVGAKLWLSPPPATTVSAALDTACDLHAGPCASAIPGGGRIELSIEPRPIPLLRPLRLAVKVEGMEAGKVEIDFTGVDMNMGYNRPELKRENGNRFTGQATLPVCITGRMAWQATVMATTDKIRVAAPFRFVTTHD